MFRNLQHDQLNFRFGMKLQPFTYKKLSQKINNSHIFNEKCDWNKLFKNGPSKICEIQPLKNYELKADHITQKKAVFHKCYFIHS